MNQGSALMNRDKIGWLQTDYPEVFLLGRVDACQDIPRGSNVPGVPTSVFVLLLPSRPWMMCAWQHSELSEQVLTRVTLGMDVKILYRTLWCQQPLVAGCLL